MKQISHVNNIVGLHDNYGMYGVFSKEAFQIIKHLPTNYPVPAIMLEVEIISDRVAIFELNEEFTAIFWEAEY